MSFKSLLKEKIEREKYVSYGDICQFSVEEGYKVETATRRLRYLCAKRNEHKLPQVPEIRAVMKISKRNTEYIAAWEWIGAGKIAMTNIDMQVQMAEQNPEYRKHIWSR